MYTRLRQACFHERKSRQETYDKRNGIYPSCDHDAEFRDEGREDDGEEHTASVVTCYEDSICKAAALDKPFGHIRYNWCINQCY